MTESQKNFAKAVKMAKAFTGDWIARMKLALRIVWKAARNAAHTATEWAKRMNQKMTCSELSCSAWEGYGKHRVYVNRRGYRKAIGYFNFNNDGEYVDSFKNFSILAGGDRVMAFIDLEDKLKNSAI